MMLSTMVQDVRFALRQLRRSPGFAVTAVLTLALGVGANTAIFSLLDQALLRSLPVRDPQQLVVLEGTGKAWQGHTSGHGTPPTHLFSYPMYRDLLSRADVFSGLIATSSSSAGVLRNGESTIENIELVSGNYFQVLGAQPAFGRLLTESDDSLSSTTAVAVLSYEFWHDRLGADPHVIGETIRVSGHPVNVIGVSAPGFRSVVWGQTPALFVPISTAALFDPYQAGQYQKTSALVDRTDRWLDVVGRLHSGGSPEAAEVRLAPLWHALRAEELKGLGTRSPSFTAEFLTNSRLRLLPGSRGLSYSREHLAKPLLLVMGMAVLVLLIASGNVASLLLVRSAGRVREFSVRYAVGATSRRIVMQLLLEGLLLGTFGAVLGVAWAPLAIRTLSSRLTSQGAPLFFHTGLDTRLLLFSFSVALAVSLVFSLAPALQFLRPDLVATLKQQAGTSGERRLGFQRAVVLLQVCLSVVLLVGAGLFVRTLQNLRRVDVGFNTAHLVTFRIQPSLAGFTQEQTAPIHRQVIEVLGAIPGVESVGGTDSAELAHADSGTNVSVEGYVAPPDEDLDVGRASVTPGYFATLQMPLIAGRTFTSTDDIGHPLVAVVNQNFARHYFGNDAAAIGRHMARGAGNKIKWMQIVGVTRDAKHISLRDPVKMTDYVPLAQEAKASELTFYLRTTRPASSVFSNVQHVMRRISPGLALESLRTMDDQISENLQDEQMIGLLAASFGVLATVLAGIGLYGVLAYSTAQRTREIGIRIALGSTRFAVSRLVLRDVLLLVGVGVAFAIPCALLLTRLIRSQLFGVSGADPLTLLIVVATMVLVALIAAAVPARRAASVDPAIALRSE